MERRDLRALYQRSVNVPKLIANIIITFLTAWALNVFASAAFWPSVTVLFAVTLIGIALMAAMGVNYFDD